MNEHRDEQMLMRKDSGKRLLNNAQPETTENDSMVRTKMVRLTNASCSSRSSIETNGIVVQNLSSSMLPGRIHSSELVNCIAAIDSASTELSKRLKDLRDSFSDKMDKSEFCDSMSLCWSLLSSSAAKDDLNFKLPCYYQSAEVSSALESMLHPLHSIIYHSTKGGNGGNPLIVGPRAVGKTTLMVAVYYLLRIFFSDQALPIFVDFSETVLLPSTIILQHIGGAPAESIALNDVLYQVKQKGKFVVMFMEEIQSLYVESTHPNYELYKSIVREILAVGKTYNHLCVCSCTSALDQPKELNFKHYISLNNTVYIPVRMNAIRDKTEFTNACSLLRSDMGASSLDEVTLRAVFMYSGGVGRLFGPVIDLKAKDILVKCCELPIPTLCRSTHEESLWLEVIFHQMLLNVQSHLDYEYDPWRYRSDISYGSAERLANVYGIYGNDFTSLLEKCYEQSIFIQNNTSRSVQLMRPGILLTLQRRAKAGHWYKSFDLLETLTGWWADSSYKRSAGNCKLPLVRVISMLYRNLDIVQDDSLIDDDAPLAASQYDDKYTVGAANLSGVEGLLIEDQSNLTVFHVTSGLLEATVTVQELRDHIQAAITGGEKLANRLKNEVTLTTIILVYTMTVPLHNWEQAWSEVIRAEPYKRYSKLNLLLYDRNHVLNNLDIDSTTKFRLKEWLVTNENWKRNILLKRR